MKLLKQIQQLEMDAHVESDEQENTVLKREKGLQIWIIRKILRNCNDK